MPGIPRGNRRCQMGFMAGVLGAGTAANASSAVAAESIQASEAATSMAVDSGMAAGGGLAASAQEAIVNEPKNFFSNAWNDTKQSFGIGENGVDMGKVGANAAKSAISKADSSEPQRMDPTPVQASAPSAPEISAEDELNKLRNRINAS